MSIQLTTVKQITGQLPIGAGNISASSNTNQKIILGDISALQFSIFAYDDTSIFYGSDMAVQGRTHINGNSVQEETA